MTSTAGLRLLTVPDRVQQVSLPVVVFHPANAPERPHQFGPYRFSAARDVNPAGDELPLIVVSHGNTGSPWTHRGLAAYLARNGYVVAMPEHLGNSRTDASLTGTAANLANRPRHVRLAVDAVLADPDLAHRVTATAIAVVGHSIGAYTALAVAGGRPTALPHEAPEGGPRTIPVERDLRVRALVLLAPACPWFMANGALADIDAPILLRTGELDEITPPAHAGIIARGLTDGVLVDDRIVGGAGHFSFQDPFPPELTRSDFPPSQDPPGFDRAAYQQTLRTEILAFVRNQIGPGHPMADGGGATSVG
jgi:predicted dienelactone hydrolase